LPAQKIHLISLAYAPFTLATFPAILPKVSITLAKFVDEIDFNKLNVLFLFFLEVITIETVSLILEVMKNRFACPKDSPHFTCLSTVYTGNVSCDFAKSFNYIGKVCRQNRGEKPNKQQLQ
jgi:hypothetical protein